LDDIRIMEHDQTISVSIRTIKIRNCKKPRKQANAVLWYDTRKPTQSSSSRLPKQPMKAACNHQA
jgi:hypothetical protein